MIQVIIADDHPALRLGLVVLLEQAPEITVVGEVGDGNEALAQVEALRPDVIVLDCRLPGLSGVSVASAIQHRRLPTRVIALSSYSDRSYVRGMFAAGALGYLIKEEAPKTIVSAVKEIAGGGHWFSPTITQHLAHDPPEGRAGSATLTERELEVLRLIAEGRTNRQIARALNISEKTVEKHLHALYPKLGVDSRVAAAVVAVTSILASNESPESSS